MSAFADTNWFEAVYLNPDPNDSAAVWRCLTAARRTRREPFLLTSAIVLLETRNVFSRVRNEPRPTEWDDLAGDINGRIVVGPMDWDALSRQTTLILERFAHKASIGTFDTTVVASAKLAEAYEVLSFDENLKALAVANGFRVFPELKDEGRAFLAKLRAR